ncbi:MAG: hypothetical protein A2498_09240 [Lentisphaerae bacterium RIFOXYC12_FULL_60_16]|nr:MAG: hypothetical protein A2498_09240 [Lentisphaerae bacterium RIFOXYC12_FULL_60_16]OGV78691.1 MAG: hypothetical protein A2340_13260 [Lentisphaerae bacterium RIFOXYB12_FULL_60_10]
MTNPSSRSPGNTAILTVVVLSSFLVPFMMAALNIALPSIGNDLELDAVMLGWVATTYLLTAAVLLLPCGRAGDLYGRRIVFLYGMGTYTVGSFLSSLAPGILSLLTARIIQGIGGAMVFSTGTAILISAVAPRNRGRALGWNVAAVYLGLSLGPVLGGIIAHDLGWRWIFGLNAGAGLLATLLTIRCLHDNTAEAVGKRFDFTGAGIYGWGLITFLYGCTRISDPVGPLCILVSILSGIYFVRHELHTASPLLDIRLVRTNLPFLLSNTAALIHYAATAGLGFILSLYLVNIRGFTPRDAGWIMIAQPVMMTLFSPLAGRWSDRIPPWKLASLGMSLTAIGLGTFCILQPDTPLWSIMTGLGILGFGFALFSSPNTHAIMGSVEPRHYGMASGILASMRSIGQMTSMAIVMMILTLVMGRGKTVLEAPEQFGRSARIACAVFSALCVAGLFASLARGRKNTLATETTTIQRL